MKKKLSLSVAIRKPNENYFSILMKDTQTREKERKRTRTRKRKKNGQATNLNDFCIVMMNE